MKPTHAQLQLLWKISRPANPYNQEEAWNTSALSRHAVSLRVCLREGWIELYDQGDQACLRLTTQGRNAITKYPDRRLSWKQYHQLIEDALRDLGMLKDVPVCRAAQPGKS